MEKKNDNRFNRLDKFFFQFPIRFKYKKGENKTRYCVIELLKTLERGVMHIFIFYCCSFRVGLPRTIIIREKKSLNIKSKLTF